ncbi:MAG: hypothetical protein CBC16_01865 [Verrucomicrobia bacterium TMED56]|nr:MAG: hypothetical protein CBC16_01865 [Verrucomicrobia bacterium TMED56]
MANVLIVGFGNIGLRHCESLVNFEKIKKIFIYDKNYEKLIDFKKKIKNSKKIKNIQKILGEKFILKYKKRIHSVSLFSNIICYDLIFLNKIYLK